MFPLIAIAVAAYFYVRYTVPILGIGATQAEADPDLSARVLRGMMVNWTIAVVLMFIGFATRDVILFVSLMVPIVTGAWMQLVKGHEGAD